MKLYKIIGAIGPDTTTLSVQQDPSEPFPIILSPRGGAALFNRDRLILYLDRNTTLVWRLIQDDILRASIEEGRRWIDDPVDEHPPHVPEPPVDSAHPTAQEAEQAL